MLPLFCSHIYFKKCPHISLFQVPDGSSPSGEKQIGGEPPRGFGVFFFLRLFSGGSDSMPHADVEFRAFPTRPLPVQPDKASTSGAHVLNFTTSTTVSETLQSFTSRFKTSQDFYSCLQNCCLPWVQL